MFGLVPVLFASLDDAASRWLSSSWDDAGMVAVSTAVIFATVIALTRLTGLRSFSKMSSFDFAMTVAIGSVMASTATSPGTTLVNGMIGLAFFYGVQALIARSRVRLGASRVVDNTALLLMHGSRMLPENMEGARVTEEDLLAKLRGANVTEPDQILAVVLETTGDVSVLHGDGPLHPRLLVGVRGLPAEVGSEWVDGISSGPHEG